MSFRRKAIDQLSKLKIFDPYAVKQAEDSSVIIDNLSVEASKLQFEKNQPQK